MDVVNQRRLLVTSRVQVQTERATGRGFLPLSGPACAGADAESHFQNAWLLYGLKRSSNEPLSSSCSGFDLSCSPQMWDEQIMSLLFFSVPELRTDQFNKAKKKNIFTSFKHSDRHVAEKLPRKISTKLRDWPSTMRNVAVEKSFARGGNGRAFHLRRHF